MNDRVSRRPRAVVATMCGIVGMTIGAIVVAPAPANAAPPGDDAVVAFLARGVGNGHGRGASQWGMYGRALAGHTYDQILATYYGGTTMGSRGGDIRVRLTPWDGASTVGVISRTGKARWHGSGTDYTSLYAVETSNNVFSVYGATAGFGCPSANLPVPRVVLSIGSPNAAAVRQLQAVLNYLGHDAGPVDGSFGQMTQAAVRRFQTAAALPVDGVWNSDDWTAAEVRLGAVAGPAWQLLGSGVAGPITFTTTVNQNTAAPGDVLGVCRSNGTLTHYRGAIHFLSTNDGNRLVNQVTIENYVRGVVPKEISPSWGTAGGGRGMESLKAQAVAARSFGLSQARYPYAGTCDTSSCQVYGGSASRSSSATPVVLDVEHANTDAAIAATAGQVRVWPSNGSVVSTEFSASHGPRTAGGTFPVVDDPFDDVAPNPLHRWTRLVDADTVMSRYQLGTANGVRSENDPIAPYDGIWDNRVNLGNGKTVSNWDFRNAFGFPSPGFELIPIRRTVTNAATFSFIGDSVGAGMAIGAGSELQILTEGSLVSPTFNAVASRRVQGGAQPDGVAVARTVPIGTDLVVVELGYNDDPATMPGRIDSMMSALRQRSVGVVLWVNVSERRTSTNYAQTNAALAAARSRWPELVIADWRAKSSGQAANRWFSDGVHLTLTGEAEFSAWLREQILTIVRDGYVPPRRLLAGTTLRVPVLGKLGVPSSGWRRIGWSIRGGVLVGLGWVRVV